jgi:ring-1,2-phenylacetyl-CoA epoxidase subunit PaaC
MAAAAQRLWPYTAEMFEHDAVDEAARVSGLGPARADLLAAWQADVAEVFAAAGLGVPADTPFRSTGTKGRHSEHLGYLLAEMQVLQRQHPGGRW